MRITGGTNPLDATSVHPESYEVTETLIQHLGYSMDDLASGQLKGITKAAGDIKALAKKLGVGTVTVTDLVKELENQPEILEAKCHSRSCVVISLK